MSDITIKMHQLAVAALKNAHAPYSKFPVGACVLASDGKLYSGCNVENACYAMGQCAEASAIGTMVTEAGGVTIDTILVVSKTEFGVMPCGGCMQKITEFATENTKVIIANCDAIHQEYLLSAIYPSKFDHTALNS